MQLKITKNKTDSIYSKKIKYLVDISEINQFISDIFLNKMSIQIQVRDSIKSIDIKNKKNGYSCSMDCSHCIDYNLEYAIYRESDTIKLNYSFDSTLEYRAPICSTTGFSTNGTYDTNSIPYDIKSILDWLYIYKLVNLTINNHEIAKRFFNKNNLDPVIEWAK